MNKAKYIIALVITCCAAVFTSCSTDGNDWQTDMSHSRVLSPNGIKAQTSEEGGAIDITFNSYGGGSFLVEASETPFPEEDNGDVLENSIKNIVDGSPATIKGLEGWKKYYIRLRALSDTKAPSYWVRYCSSSGDPKAVKTTGVNVVSDEIETTTKSIAVSWASYAGANKPERIMVTTTKQGEETSVDYRNLTEDEINNKKLVVEGLESNVEYTIYLYQGAEIIGNVKATTDYAAPDGAVEVTTAAAGYLTATDLANWTKAGYTKVLVKVADGATLQFGTGSSGADLTIPDGISLSIVGGENSSVKWRRVYVKNKHDYLQFVNLNVTPLGNYNLLEFQDGTTASPTEVNEVTFLNCKFNKLTRGLVDVEKNNKGTEGYKMTLNIVNCVINSNNTTKPLIYINGDGGCPYINIKKTTIYNWPNYFFRYGASDYSGLKTIDISDCTFYNVYPVDNYFFDSGTGASPKINITNTIISNIMNARFRTGGKLEFENYQQLSDVRWSVNEAFEAGETDGTTVVDKDSEGAFQDPAKADFTLKLEKKCGDPRWYK